MTKDKSLGGSKQLEPKGDGEPFWLDTASRPIKNGTTSPSPQLRGKLYCTGDMN